jgi:hypothetical protein
MNLALTSLLLLAQTLKFDLFRRLEDQTALKKFSRNFESRYPLVAPVPAGAGFHFDSPRSRQPHDCLKGCGQLFQSRQARPYLPTDGAPLRGLHVEERDPGPRTTRQVLEAYRRAPDTMAAVHRAAVPPKMPVHAASVPCSPSFDNGSVNEILWYGTFAITEPRAPWLS